MVIETMLAGVDLAWQSEKNPSAIALGSLHDGRLLVEQMHPAVVGIDNVIDVLLTSPQLTGAAIDAPLVIPNEFGQRLCERSIARVYSSRRAACHTSNQTLYPAAKSVFLSQALLSAGFQHLLGDKWQIECYPHPALIEIFGLPERLKYKKGRVQEKKQGQKQLASLLLSLGSSPILKLHIPDAFSKYLNGAFIDALKGQALKSNEDALDSLVCLYIAGLYQIGARSSVHGNAADGYVVVPTPGCAYQAL